MSTAADEHKSSTWQRPQPALVTETPSGDGPGEQFESSVGRDLLLDSPPAVTRAEVGDLLHSQDVSRVLADFHECVRWERDGTNVTVPVADLRVAASALSFARTHGYTLEVTERAGGPELNPEYDEQGAPVPGTLVAGWSVSFGCRMNFGPGPDGSLSVDVHVSDATARDGVAVQAVTTADLRTLAAHLLTVADEQDRVHP